jgi:ribosomal protein S18 acetylase RimI-like enzyme
MFRSPDSRRGRTRATIKLPEADPAGSGYTIERVRYLSADMVEAMASLLPQLSPERVLPSASDLALLVEDERVHLFVGRAPDGAIHGAVALVLYRVPTGVRARIEDLVVAHSVRRLGLGRALMLHALQAARAAQAHVVDLTSNPSRAQANALYLRLGFQRWETNVYRMVLDGPTDSADPPG